MYINEIQGKCGVSAKMVADSISTVYGQETRISTLELTFHRYILPENNTHRMFSRNASSSRAIPVKKLNNDIITNPAMPVHWGANQSGMQAGDEIDELVKWKDSFIPKEQFWKNCAKQSVDNAKALLDAGYHKEIVNRMTECYQFSKVIVTATEWDNFFNLRDHPAAQPEIRELAKCMRKSFSASKPSKLNPGQWHLPYITDEDLKRHPYNSTNRINMEKKVELFWQEMIHLSVARCARVSYMNHDNTSPDIQKDLKLHDMLYTMGHMSPFEHQATPMPNSPIVIGRVMEHLQKQGITHMDANADFWSANFKDWIQYRHKLEDIGEKDET